MQSSNIETEPLTVFWVLTILTTIAAELFYVLLSLIESAGWKWQTLPNLIALIFFISLCTGAIVLISTPLVLKFAKVRPPKAFVYVGMVAGVLPIFWLLVAWALS